MLLGWDWDKREEVGKYLLGLYCLHKETKTVLLIAGGNLGGVSVKVSKRQAGTSKKHLIAFQLLQESGYGHHSSAGPPMLYEPVKLVQSINHPNACLVFFPLPLYLYFLFRNSMSIIRKRMGELNCKLLHWE